MHTQVISRTKNPGRTCTGSAAYRAGEKLTDLQGNVHDYTRKQNVVFSDIMLPKGASHKLKDRETLWNSSESAEKRKDAQLYRDTDVAFPNSFTYEDCIWCMRLFCYDNFTTKGMCVDYAIHDTTNPDGQRNLHGHIMLTMRDLNEDGLTFGKKNRSWNEHDLEEVWRKDFCDIINIKLREKEKEQWDHRSYKRQGKDIEPMKHEGVVATALKRKGKDMPVVKENRIIRGLRKTYISVSELIFGAEKSRKEKDAQKVADRIRNGKKRNMEL